MLNIIGLIIYIVLAFLTAAIIYSIRTDEVGVSMYGMNCASVFLIGLITIPLFGLPLLSSALFIIAGVAMSLISLTRPNRFLLLSSAIASRIFLIGISKEERKRRYLNSYAKLKKHFKTEEDTKDEENDKEGSS